MLKEEFFKRSSVEVARDLIGCFLCTKSDCYMIVETESYEGPKDLASHASRGKTKRNEVMFGKPGRWYVYFTYGMHHMLNIVCGDEGHPGAVLIRGITYPHTPSPREGASKTRTNLLGPAKLTKYLKIDKKFNGKTASKKTGLWIESPTLKTHGRSKIMSRKKLKILRTPRIGVSYAGPIWSRKKYRFVLDGYETKKFKRSGP